MTVDDSCGGRLTLVRQTSRRAAATARPFLLKPGTTTTILLQLIAAARKSKSLRLVVGAADRRAYIAPIVKHLSIDKLPRSHPPRR